MLTPDQRMVLNGLGHLITDGRDFIALIESDPRNYSRAYTEWETAAEKFLGTHLTSAHVVRFRSPLGLPPLRVPPHLPQRHVWIWKKMHGYLVRIETFSEEIKS